MIGAATRWRQAAALRLVKSTAVAGGVGRLTSGLPLPTWRSVHTAAPTSPPASSAPSSTATQGRERGSGLVMPALSHAAAGGVSLRDIIRNMILLRGPLSMAEYMKLCLSHPTHGYYMKRDVFGTAGDFTTAPEISQMFGELVGIWLVAVWSQLHAAGKVSSEHGFCLVETGPGRGTLAADVLRVIRRFPRMAEQLRGVHLVETSPALRQVQARKLGCTAIPPPIDPSSGNAEILPPFESTCGPDGLLPGVSVHWCRGLQDVPTGAPVLLMAQELFDALPVHQLVWTARGWRERLIDVAEQGDGLRFVVAPSATPASAAYSAWRKQLLGDAAAADTPAEGDVLEHSPVSQSLADAIGKRIATDGGAALIVDYGSERSDRWTVRGIKQHAFVDVLSHPGDVDLSADVDFSVLRAAAEGGAACQALGPVTQKQFLESLGIQARLQRLLQASTNDAASRRVLLSEVHRLTDPSEMGTIYKAMAIVQRGALSEAPPGFSIAAPGNSSG